MGLGGWLKDKGHKTKEGFKGYNLNRKIQAEEKERVRQIVSIWKPGRLHDLCDFIGKYPPKTRPVTEEFGERNDFTGMRETRTRQEPIPQTKELFVKFLSDNCKHETAVKFADMKNLQIDQTLKQQVVSFAPDLEAIFRKLKIEDCHEVIIELGWEPNDVKDLENLKKRIWNEIKTGKYTEDEISRIISENMGENFKTYSPVFEEIVNKIKSDWKCKIFNDEYDVHSQLEIWLELVFPNVRVVRTDNYTTTAGTKAEIELTINDEFAIEVKVPQANNDLRALIGQLHEETGKNSKLSEVVVVAIDTGGWQRTIEDFAKEYMEKYGVETIIKKGHKRGVSSNTWKST